MDSPQIYGSQSNQHTRIPEALAKIQSIILRHTAPVLHSQRRERSAKMSSPILRSLVANTPNPISSRLVGTSSSPCALTQRSRTTEEPWRWRLRDEMGSYVTTWWVRGKENVYMEMEIRMSDSWNFTHQWVHGRFNCLWWSDRSNAYTGASDQDWISY